MNVKRMIAQTHLDVFSGKDIMMNFITTIKLEQFSYLTYYYNPATAGYYE